MLRGILAVLQPMMPIFSSQTNLIYLRHGRSSVELPRILPALTQPTQFVQWKTFTCSMYIQRRLQPRLKVKLTLWQHSKVSAFACRFFIIVIHISVLISHHSTSLLADHYITVVGNCFYHLQLVLRYFVETCECSPISHH